MTIRTSITLLASAWLAAAGPVLAEEAAAPHAMDIHAPDETEGLTIGDLSGGVGADSALGGGGGNVIQIMQIQPSAGVGNGVSTSSSAPRFVSGSH
jgi:hypothetical protein